MTSPPIPCGVWKWAFTSSARLRSGPEVRMAEGVKDMVIMDCHDKDYDGDE